MRNPVPSVLVGLVLGAALAPTAAQTPDSAAAPRAGSCVLEWGAPPGGQSPALRHTEGDGGLVADFFSGRTLFTCGSATMLADSAVNYQSRREVYLVGNVVYRDSLRTLESETLTYYELADLVVAIDSVRLVRTTDRSTLEGPRVEFLRAVSGIDELTTATGRPHMTLYPEGDEPGPPFEIDADRTVFAGEDEARAYGNVVIDREDMQGEADSVRMRRIDETGEMWGDPWIEAEGVRLEGETIRFRSQDDELEEIHAVGDGRAIGESFEVHADVIDIAVVEQQPERVWAHGRGLARALSGAHNVYGDSLEFAMFEGAIDTVYAVGEAVALQGDQEIQLVELPPPPFDSIGSPAGDSLPITAADSAAVPDPDSLAATGPDSLTAAEPDTLTAAPPDSPAADSGAAEAESAGEGVEPGGPVARPRLSVQGDATWIRGDTVIAIFERPGRGETPAEPGAAVPVPVSADTAAARTLAEQALATADSSAIVPVEPPAADTAADPLMERLVAIGQARSLFSRVRDSTQTSRRSKNYLMGKRIEILFENGEPAEVFGTEAIGVFLDPEDVMTAGAGAAADTAGMVPPGEAVPDSLVAPPDSLAPPPDSLVAPPDSTVARRGGTVAVAARLQGVEELAAARIARGVANRERRDAAWNR